MYVCSKISILGPAFARGVITDSSQETHTLHNGRTQRMQMQSSPACLPLSECTRSRRLPRDLVLLRPWYRSSSRGMQFRIWCGPGLQPTRATSHPEHYPSTTDGVHHVRGPTRDFNDLCVHCAVPPCFPREGQPIIPCVLPNTSQSPRLSPAAATATCAAPARCDRRSRPALPRKEP